MLTLPEALNYEIQSSRIAPRISWPFLQDLLAWHFARKTKKKHERYTAVENMRQLFEDFK